MSTDFKLFPTQREALTTEAKEILFGGSVGGGKSYLARVASIVYSLEIPGLITYLFRRTFKDLVANHLYTPGGYTEMLHDLLEAGDVVFSKSDYSFTFYNGSRIQFAHCQYESDVHSYQGAQIGFLIIDEATHFTAAMVRFLRSRVRLGSMQVPDIWKNRFPRILYTANPGGPGHLFFKSNFVDHGVMRLFDAPEDEGSMRRIFIPAKLKDNKVLLQNDPDYAQRVKGLGDTVLVDAMLTGDWEGMSTGGFGDLWRSKIHVLDAFHIPVGWEITRGYDYGSSAPAATLWFAESDGEDFVNAEGELCWVPKGTIFVINELYFANKRNEGLKLQAFAQGERIKTYELDEGLHHKTKPGPADNSIFNPESTGPSIAEEMAKSNITFVRSNKRPGSRVQGVQLLRTRLSASSKRPMEQPGIFFFRNCYHSIRTIPNLSNDPKNPDDIDTMSEDHCYDVVKYRLLHGHRQGSMTKVGGL